MNNFQQFSNELALHSTSCVGSVNFCQEKKLGLASIIKGHCTHCQKCIKLETSAKVKGPRGYIQWESNLAAVWGEMVTGGGHSNLEEIMSILGIPVLTKPCFINIERGIGEFWKCCLTDSMIEAGKEEKRLAEMRGNYHEGVPAITVVVDGGWSKRSHKHSYNAKSGVAIIAGKQTGKLLHIGVRNKFCAACSRNTPQENHACFRNWSKSSSEMESDIILQGFMEAEKVHGIRYTRFIGDGDSSVHVTLLQGVPEWGHAIKKLECANHACKCYRNALEKLVQENSSYKGKGGLTLQMRKRLVSSARCAIKMRSAETNRREAVKLLQRDLINGPNHCFGLHHACSVDFCSTARIAAAETISTTEDLSSLPSLAMTPSSALPSAALSPWLSVSSSSPSASLSSISESSRSLSPVASVSSSSESLSLVASASSFLAVPFSVVSSSVSEVSSSLPIAFTPSAVPQSSATEPVSVTITAPASIHHDNAEDRDDIFGKSSININMCINNYIEYNMFIYNITYSSRFDCY